MEYENKVFEEWENLIRGIPVDYHKRLADRVVACLGDRLDESKVEDALCDMRYHRRQIDDIYKSDLTRDRYDKHYLKLLEEWRKRETTQALNTS